MIAVLIKLVAAMFVIFCIVPESYAQIQENFVVTKLFQPVYPSLAKQTRITGDVELTLGLRKDGSLESVDVRAVIYC
jgi:hypothetical protein